MNCERVYSIYGCRVASRVPLPLDGAPVNSVSADLEFESHDVPGDPLDAPLTGLRTCYESPFYLAGRPRVTLHRAGDRLDLRVVGCGRFVVSPNRVVLYRSRETDLRDIVAVFLGSVLSLWREQCGALALHAAAVADDSGRAMAFCGGSGTGKSTLIRRLVADGYRFISDDVLMLTFENGSVQCHPGPPAIRLTQDSAMFFGDTAAPACMKAKRRYDVAMSCRDRTQLGAIFLLERAGSMDSARITDLSPTDAMIGVLKNGFIGCLSERVRPRARLHQVGETCRIVNVRRLVIPDRLDALPDVSAVLSGSI